MHEKPQPMLPSPGGPRLTRPPSGRPGPLCPRMFSRSLLRRRRFYGLLAFFGLALYYFRVLASPRPVPGYESYFNQELENAADAASKEEKVRYVHFKTRSYSRADEAFSSLLLYAHLAYASDRAYVFDPLEPAPLGKYQMWWSQTKVVPLTAIMDMGKNWDAKDSKLKPVSSLGWHQICPRLKRTVFKISPQDLSQANYNPKTLMDTWARELKNSNAHCVEVVGELFTDRVLGYPLIQPLFDTISTSPILKHYTFSYKVYDVASTIVPKSSIVDGAPTVNNTVVLQAHLPPQPLNSRTSDDPCGDLASLGAPFRTFAHLRGLPTVFELPGAPSYYAQRCNPTVSELVGRLGALRTAFPSSSSSGSSKLKHVYVIDGPMGLTPVEWSHRKRWFEELRFELTKQGWNSVRWARAGAKAEAVAIDMEVAASAEAFIGNGFSDFSSNVVLLRTVKGKSKGTIRFV
ncbi:transmembrane protein [Ceratobasidium sp. AG-Ba]|nr:transmembrane protein [Ceratobasidium sp. AG-Ba]QRV99537.1 transmembrane protein [Ceratobasidium sp. AG-Ba]